MSNSEQLFGKALQTLVTTALLKQNLAGKDQVSILEISKQILANKPGLKIHIRSQQDMLKFRRRILNCVKQLHKANLIEIEEKKAEQIGIKYYIIYTKII